MVKEYRVNDDLSKNFKVKEFQCHDGSEVVLIDSDLVEKLQALRDYLGKPISIVSGYRTESYNASCGGAKGSYHLKGMAADIFCKGVKPIIIALWAEMNGMGGVGLYLNRSQEFVHIDTRQNKYYWINRSGTNTAIPTITDLL